MKRPTAALILALVGLLLGPGVAAGANSQLTPSPPVGLPSAPGKASRTPARPAAQGKSPLPHTGFGLVLAGLIGVAMIGAGTALRGRPRHLQRR